MRDMNGTEIMIGDIVSFPKPGIDGIVVMNDKGKIVIRQGDIDLDITPDLCEKIESWR